MAKKGEQVGVERPTSGEPAALENSSTKKGRSSSTKKDEKEPGGCDGESGGGNERPQYASSALSSSVAAIRNHVVLKRLRQRRRQGYGDVDTVSYEPFDSEIWNQHKADIIDKEKEAGAKAQSKRQSSNYLSRRFHRNVGEGRAHQRQQTNWLRLTIIGIGFVTSAIGFLIIYLADNLTNSYQSYIGITSGESGATTYWSFLAFSLCFALVAALPIVFVRPVAAGSGIAEAKAVLNGIMIPSCTELTSAACKGISLIFAEASSLPAGLEGPLIFIGMALGENINRLIPQKFPELRSWRLKRDLAAVGTAAGVTVAFLSPIGGIMFAAEEGASFISTRLLWQCFAAGITVVILEYLWILIQEGTFGDTEQFVDQLARYSGLPGQLSSENSLPSFSFYEYFVIAGVGVIGGIVGACFIEISKFFSRMRKVHVDTAARKVLEVLIIAALSTTVIFWLPSLPKISTCIPIEIAQADPKYFVQFNCEGGHYNDLATLLRNPLPVAINLLFWEHGDAFSAVACIVASITILSLLALTFGASIAIGIFVPLLFAGAAIGRAFALLYEDFDVRTYAIIGAASTLNGVVRVLISLPIIMMETTALTTLVSPLMIASVVSRYCGKSLFLSDGIYDEILKIRQLPFLEEEPPEVTKRLVLRAKDVMSANLIKLEPVMRVGAILDVLKEHSHLDYPVTNTSNGGILVGSISRATLKELLWNKAAFTDCGDTDNDEESGIAPACLVDLSYDDLSLEEMEQVTDAELFEHLNDEDKGMYIHLSRYMTLSPITFTANGSCERAFELFRTHGLRHLIVVDEEGRIPVGVITRFDLKILEEEEDADLEKMENIVASVAGSRSERSERSNTLLTIS
eukprot:CAMPEP_0197440956 /NCGR_PEP_ID=MMETSP1175-20131217/7327_1 /TAXON_ID=1003142 /ORGANISM="Triceratium dubium, Strain CCMP147" /LENGTH=857 /DNA_ID=CAMNT_0042971151 /DNA_START=81 /DNA_END=2654 /DNA_ORIENTATION=+